MKKSAKPAPAKSAMAIYDDPFGDLSDRELLIYEEEMDKKEKIELSLVPEAYVPPNAQHSMK
eukprot:14957281-Ditylum_brightwellii.AAC.1